MAEAASQGRGVGPPSDVHCLAAVCLHLQPGRLLLLLLPIRSCRCHRTERGPATRLPMRRVLLLLLLLLLCQGLHWLVLQLLRLCTAAIGRRPRRPHHRCRCGCLRLIG